MNSRRLSILVAAIVTALGTLSVSAQSTITTPPSGDNQHSIVTQYIGPVQVTIDYHSPDVHAPDGTDRHGAIWGKLVPYGLNNLGFGTCTECPWRAGANENTTLSVSNDVEIEGKPLAAGTYGLFMIAQPDQWTVVFSKNSTSWGSFFYDPAEDALRVQVTPEKNPYHEWLTYAFTDRQTDHATVALMWEDLAVPIRISVPHIDEVYLSRIARELRSSPGFLWENWNAAAQYAIATGHPKEALAWAEKGASPGFGTSENFTTLMTLAQAQEMNDLAAEAKATRSKALSHPTADPISIHQYGRQLLSEGKKQEALEVFETNHRRFGDTWPVNVGLARGYSATGDFRKALKYARAALAQAPDDLNRQSLQSMIEKLQKGEDVN